jgi:hypothetical protein
MDTRATAAPSIARRFAATRRTRTGAGRATRAARAICPRLARFLFAALAGWCWMSGAFAQSITCTLSAMPRILPAGDGRVYLTATCTPKRKKGEKGAKAARHAFFMLLCLQPPLHVPAS